MKRILPATAGVAVVAVFAATIGFAQPAAETGSVRAETAAPLPKLPADIASRNRFIIGVKCDAPPFGYINVQGRRYEAFSQSGYLAKGVTVRVTGLDNFRLIVTKTQTSS